MDINPVIYDPKTFPQFVVCAMIWATFLAVFCAVWLLIEEMNVRPDERRTENRSGVYRFGCKYLTVFVLTLGVYMGALHFSPVFGVAVTHFFATSGI